MFLRQPISHLFELCESKLKRTLLLVHGFRSVQEQMLIYQKGRTYNRESGVWEVTSKGEVVSNAKPGQSAHNVVTKLDGKPAALAVDVIPFTADGGLNWNPPESFWDSLYELAWKVGLDPLGDPIGAYLPGDAGHLEEPGWRYKLADMGLILPTSEMSRSRV